MRGEGFYNLIFGMTQHPPPEPIKPITPLCRFSKFKNVGLVNIDFNQFQYNLRMVHSYVVCRVVVTRSQASEVPTLEIMDVMITMANISKYDKRLTIR